MTDHRHAFLLHRAALLAATAVLVAEAAVGQGMRPPIPGPFPVMNAAVRMAPMPMPNAPGGPDRSAAARPLFQPPEGAMRLPYWMQAPTPTPTPAAPATGEAETVPPRSEAPAAVQRPTPSYPAPRQPAAPGAPQGYAAQAPWPMQPMQPMPGYGMAPPAGGYGQQPGWGYGAPSGWTPAPFAPQPGWAGGWAQPVPGASQ